jgi:hypothetical protein
MHANAHGYGSDKNKTATNHTDKYWSNHENRSWVGKDLMKKPLRLTFTIVISFVLLSAICLGIFLIYVSYKRSSYADFKRQADPCKLTMRNIIVCWSAYAEELNTWPSDLNALKQYGLEKQLSMYPAWFCPYARRDGKVGDYIYIAPKEKSLTDLSGKEPILFDYPGNHKNGGGDVGFSDGHVVFVDQDSFNKLLNSNLPPGYVLKNNNLKWYEW